MCFIIYCKIFSWFTIPNLFLSYIQLPQWKSVHLFPNCTPFLGSICTLFQPIRSTHLSNLMNHIIASNYSTRPTLATIIWKWLLLSQFHYLLSLYWYLDGKNTVKMERKCVEVWHRSSGVLEKWKLMFNAASCWAWLAIHDSNGPTVLPLCVTLNLGNISLSRFCTISHLEAKIYFLTDIFSNSRV